MGITEILEKKLNASLSPTHLRIRNDSEKHAGHAGYDGSGESHFYLEIESEKFRGLSLIQRQRMVHEVLKDELKARIHALSMRLKVPE